MARVVGEIEKELRDVSDIKPKVGEARQGYLERLCKAVQDLDEKDWESLSDSAQRWNNAAASAIKSDKDIAEFPDAEGEGKAGDKKSAKDAGAKGTANNKSKSKAGDGNGGKESAADKPKKAKGTNSPRRRIKMMLVKKPGMTIDDIIDKLGPDNKLTRLTVSSIRNSTRDTLRVLVDAGLLNMEL